MPENIKVLIVEDELGDYLDLRRQLERPYISILNDDAQLVQIATKDKLVHSIAAAKEAIRVVIPHIIFLDLKLAGIEDGTALIKWLYSEGLPSAVIITSVNATNRAFEIINTMGFMMRRLYFIQKPIRQYVLDQSIEQYLAYCAIQFENIFLKKDDIIYCEGRGDYVDIYLTNGNFKIIKSTVTRLYEKLGKGEFLRPGSTSKYILKRTKIKEVDIRDQTITLISDPEKILKEIPNPHVMAVHNFLN